MGLSAVRCSFLLFLGALCTCAFSTASAAAVVLPIDRQVAILWQAAEEILAANPEAATQVRLLGVGSWMSGTATSASDVDITLGHPNPAVEKRLAGRIQARVEQLAAEAGGKHEVLVTYRGHHLFKDRFRGAAGQAFVADYADLAAEGEGSFAYRPGPDGRLVRSRIATERFWLDQGLKVPQQVTRAYTFAEDSVIFMERMATQGKPIAVQAEKAAKYLNNYEAFLKGKLRQQWTDISTLQRLSPEAEHWLRGMRAYKRDLVRLTRDLSETLPPQAAETAAQEQAMARLRRFMGAADQAELERGMERFVADTKNYLTRAAEDVDSLEGAFRFRMADRARSAEALLKLKDSIKRVLGRSLLHGFEAYLIMHTYYQQRAEAAMQTTLTIAAMHAVPAAGLAALAAELAKDLFSGAVAYGGQALIFDPINDYWLKEWAFDESSPVYIFGRWAGSGDRRLNSPFGRLRRETLACVYDDREGLLDQHMDLYLQQVKDWRAGNVATAGAGSVRPALRQRLHGDLARSRQMLSAISTLSLQLAGGVYEPVDPPLDLLVNGAEEGPVRGLIDPDGRLAFGVHVNARFGRGESLPLERGTVRDYFCANGLAATRQWLEQNKLTGFRPSYTLEWTVSIHSPGWVLAREPGYGRIEPDQSGLASRDYPLQFRRADAGAGDLDATLRLFSGFAQGETRQHFEKTLRLSGTSGAGSLVLRVVGTDGSPVRGASVRMDGERDYDGRTDARGQAMLHALLPGKYALTVSAEGYQAFAGQQSIAENQASERRVTLQATATASLEITVLDQETRQAIAGALVDLSGPANASAHSDGKGTARLSDIPPGRFTITVSARGYQTAEGQRRLSAGEQLRRKVELRPESAKPVTPLPGAVVPPVTPQPPQAQDSCWEQHRQKIDNALAANSDGDGGLVVIYASAACKTAHKKCYDDAFDAGTRCRSDAKTVEQSQACNGLVSRGWERCAYQEVQCSATHLKAECGMGDPQPPKTDSAADACWAKHRQTVENALKANSDGDSGYVTLHASAACKAAHQQCEDTAYRQGAACRSANGTEAGQKACNEGVMRGWERCAYQEVQCSASALKRECGMQ